MIALFTTFVSVTTNYTRTYKIKDNLIAIIEKHGGVTGGDYGTLQEINTYLDSLGYTATGSCPREANNPNQEGSSETWHPFSRTKNDDEASGFGDKANYCIYKHVISCRVDKATGAGGKKMVTYTGELGYNTLPRAYYGVATFFRLDWPILREVIKVELRGETATLFLPKANYEVPAFASEGGCAEVNLGS
jgi:hypothetical protein